MGPCVRVWSREIGKSFERSEVAEAFEAGPIVVSHEAIEEGVAIGMARKGSPALPRLGSRPMASAIRRLKRSTRPLVASILSGQAVIDLVISADEIEWVIAGSLPCGCSSYRRQSGR